MAREVIIRMSDDFDRSLPADEVIEFTYQGVTYILDLTTEHADEFRETVKPYMEAAHEVVKLTKDGKPSKRGSAGLLPKAKYYSPEGETTAERDKMREWAAANGFPTMPRGLVKDEIRQAYSAATGNPVRLNVKMRSDDVKMEQMELMPKHVREGHEVIARQREADEQAAASADELFHAAVAKLPRPAPVAPRETKAEAAKKAKKAPAKAPAQRAPDEPNSMGITQEMRDWARANGHNIRHGNGYIPRNLQRQFEEEKAAGMLTAHAEQNGALV
jgi:hypothetical protein